MRIKSYENGGLHGFVLRDTPLRGVNFRDFAFDGSAPVGVLIDFKENDFIGRDPADISSSFHFVAGASSSHVVEGGRNGDARFDRIPDLMFDSCFFSVVARRAQSPRTFRSSDAADGAESRA